MRPSGTFRSSISAAGPAFWLLDALADAPTSFAASLVFIREAWGDQAERLTAEDQITVVRDLVTAGYVEARLQREGGTLSPLSDEDWEYAKVEYISWLDGSPSASREDVLYDSVGLWLALTAQGRREWSRLAAHKGHTAPSSWHADFDGERNVLWVAATSEVDARNKARAFARQLGMELEPGAGVRAETTPDGTQFVFAVRSLRN